MSKEVLGQVTSCNMTEQVWEMVLRMYVSQSRAHVMHLHANLVNTRKGELPIASYYTKMKEYINEMAAAHKQLEDDDVISYILTWLDAEYNNLLENISSRTDSIAMSNLFAQLLAVEARIENQHQVEMSVNAAVHGGGSFRGRGGHDGGRGS
jgi:hypothetical protein